MKAVAAIACACALAFVAVTVTAVPHAHGQTTRLLRQKMHRVRQQHTLEAANVAAEESSADGAAVAVALQELRAGVGAGLGAGFYNHATDRVVCRNMLRHFTTDVAAKALLKQKDAIVYGPNDVVDATYDKLIGRTRLGGVSHPVPPAGNWWTALGVHNAAAPDVNYPVIAQNPATALVAHRIFAGVMVLARTGLTCDVLAYHGICQAMEGAWAGGPGRQYYRATMANGALNAAAKADALLGWPTAPHANSFWTHWTSGALNGGNHRRGLQVGADNALVQASAEIILPMFQLRTEKGREPCQHEALVTAAVHHHFAAKARSPGCSIGLENEVWDTEISPGIKAANTADVAIARAPNLAIAGLPPLPSVEVRGDSGGGRKVVELVFGPVPSTVTTASPRSVPGGGGPDPAAADIQALAEVIREHQQVVQNFRQAVMDVGRAQMALPDGVNGVVDRTWDTRATRAVHGMFTFAWAPFNAIRDRWEVLNGQSIRIPNAKRVGHYRPGNSADPHVAVAAGMCENTGQAQEVHWMKPYRNPACPVGAPPGGQDLTEWQMSAVRAPLRLHGAADNDAGRNTAADNAYIAHTGDEWSNNVQLNFLAPISAVASQHFLDHFLDFQENLNKGERIGHQDTYKSKLLTTCARTAAVKYLRHHFGDGLWRNNALTNAQRGDLLGLFTTFFIMMTPRVALMPTKASEWPGNTKPTEAAAEYTAVIGMAPPEFEKNFYSVLIKSDVSAAIPHMDLAVQEALLAWYTAKGFNAAPAFADTQETSRDDAEPTKAVRELFRALRQAWAESGNQHVAQWATRLKGANGGGGPNNNRWRINKNKVLNEFRIRVRALNPANVQHNSIVSSADSEYPAQRIDNGAGVVGVLIEARNPPSDMCSAFAYRDPYVAPNVVANHAASDNSAGIMYRALQGMCAQKSWDGAKANGGGKGTSVLTGTV